MHVQLVGPISGRPNFNDDNFQRVQELLEGWGHEVWSPHNRTAAQIAEAESLAVGDIGSRQVHHFWMRVSMEKLCSGWPHLVCALDEWDSSRGACLEILCAYYLGVGIIDERGQPLDPGYADEALTALMGLHA